MSTATNNDPASGFFVVGGTLRRDAPSYVPRAADENLYASLAGGEFCYVLTPRQMGKSSLMVRTAARLRAEGSTAVVIDLTEVGQNLTVDQWYKGMLGAIGEQLGLDDEISDAWRARRDLGPLQRWLRIVREVVLPHCVGRVVIFVDEIDAVRSLPFSTDEFFAGIRELHNRRTEAPELERLTFCLLGVAAPTDLIRDTRTTPFNIGRRIELEDFTREDAWPLVIGLGRDAAHGEALLERVLYWTGGHPYLTQRLCRAVAGDPTAESTASVDRICDAVFLSRRAAERDDNLLFVRDRILRSEVDLTELLELYERIWSGDVVADDDGNPLITVLKLSGIVRVVQGQLRVRNRIYGRVFDDEWIHTNVPGAELRRQRRAVRRGAVRTAAVAFVILAVVAALAINAIWQRNRAEQEQRTAEEQRQIAQNEQASKQRLLYDAHMSLAYQAFERDDFVRVAQLLEEERATPDRGFEYFYLWRQVHRDTKAFLAGDAVNDVTFSPDGRLVAGVTNTGAIVWDYASGKEVKRLDGEPYRGYEVRFSKDAKQIVISSPSATIRFVDIESGRVAHEYKGDPNASSPVGLARMADSRDFRIVSGDDSGLIHVTDPTTGRDVATMETKAGTITGLVVSDDGARIVTGHSNGDIFLWDGLTHTKRAKVEGQPQFVRRAAFSPDGRLLVTGSGEGDVIVWDASTGAQVRMLRHTSGGVAWVTFSPDGERVAFSALGTVELWSVTGTRLAVFPGHTDIVGPVAFSPDGSMLVSGSADRTVRFWSTAERIDRSEPLPGHTEAVYSVAYSPDGRLLASASFDGTIGLWDTASGGLVRRLTGHTGWVRCVAFTPDGTSLLSSGDDHTVRLWDVASGLSLRTFEGNEDNVFSISVSPDGRRVASAGFDGKVRVWEIYSGVLAMTLEANTPGSVECVSYSPDGTLIAGGGENHDVTLWNAATGEILTTLEGHTDWVNALTFTPDGRYLISAGSYSDTRVLVWDVSRRQIVYELKGFSGAAGFTPQSFMGGNGRANCLRVSPDGLTLAAVTVDKTLKFFDLKTGQEITTLGTAHGTQIYGVAFAPDGRTITTASEDGGMYVWRTATPEEIAVYVVPPERPPDVKPDMPTDPPVGERPVRLEIGHTGAAGISAT